MTKTVTHPILLLCLALAVSMGCGGDAKKQDARAAKADSKPASKAATKPAVEKAAEKPAEDPGPERSMETPEGRVALAAMVASQIADAPDQADEILERNGLDRDKLDELMYEIARDPALSRAYKDLRMAG